MEPKPVDFATFKNQVRGNILDNLEGCFVQIANLLQQLDAANKKIAELEKAMPVSNGK